MRELDVLGAGRLGTALARRAVGCGLEVGLWRRLHEMPAAGREHPAGTEAPGAGLPPIVLALPLERLEELDREALAGRVVVDAMNAWGDAAEELPAAVHPDGTSGAVADHLAGAHVVKALNHLSYRDLAGPWDPAPSAGAGGPRPFTGPEGPQALLVAGDDPAARATVARVVERLGFAPVELPRLADGRIAEPGHALFGVHHSAGAMRTALEHHGVHPATRRAA
ncbi:NADPH-dependent F420 reductase [Kytococcus sp. Marseille-QA3725]